MNQYVKSPRPPRPNRPLITLLLVCLAISPAPLRAEGAWPEAAPAHGEAAELSAALEDVSAGERRGYFFAAGLYRALETSLKDADPRVAELGQMILLARGLFGQGRDEEAAAILASRDDFPYDLALLALLAADGASSMGDLERERWRELLSADDGESLYWRARLEVALGESETARASLRKLLRREPGSVFASAALELLEGLPLKEALDETPSIVDFVPTGFRIQWGVFRDPLRARRQREAVVAYGQEAEILPFRKDGIELYRVCSPPFNQADAARETAGRLEERYGLDYVIHESKTGQP